MKQAINPQDTTRAYAFEMWMQAPMPMVTFFRTFNVSHLLRISRCTSMKFNMLMCWCIGKAASGIKEFYKYSQEALRITDLGIVKYHFEVAAGKENFEWITL